MNEVDRPALPSLVEIAGRIRSREASPVEVVVSALQQIERLNPILNAYITVLGEDAMRAAEEAEREIAAGEYRGPLHGVPVSVKDLLWAQGVRTTSGSRIFADCVPDEDSTVVQRLRAAGAILIAKANLMEFAYGAAHPDYGPTKNPWDLSTSAYGSSGGSTAAVASGMDFGSFGSDTGGSIRIPAAFCGVAGLKPSSGQISRFGMQLGSRTLDQLGPIARSVQDIAILMTTVSGPDARDPSASTTPALDFESRLSDSLHGYRVAVVTNLLEATPDPEIRDAVTRAAGVFGDAGALVSEIELPEIDGIDISGLMKISGAEASYRHRDWLTNRPGDYSKTVLERLQAGSRLTAWEYLDALARRELLAQRVAEVQRDIDLLVLPTTLMVSTDMVHDIDSPDRGPYTASDFIRLTVGFNLTGQPALTLPCGFSRAGLPIGMQIAGRMNEDGLVLRAGHAYQLRTDWHRQSPPPVGSEGRI